MSGAAYSTSLEEIKKNVTTEMSGRGFVSNSPKVNDNLHQTSRSESIQETTERIRTQTTSEKFNYFTSQTQPELTSSAEPLSSSTAASKDWLKSEKHYAKPIEESASTNVAVGGTKFSLSGIKTTTFYPDINKISPVSTEFVTGKNAKIQTDSSRINISKSTIVLSSSVENLSKITQTTAKLITGTNLAQKTTFTAKKMTNAFEPKQNETATTTHNRNVAGSTSGIQATAELHDKGIANIAVNVLRISSCFNKGENGQIK